MVLSFTFSMPPQTQTKDLNQILNSILKCLSAMEETLKIPTSDSNTGTTPPQFPLCTAQCRQPPRQDTRRNSARASTVVLPSVASLRVHHVTYQVRRHNTARAQTAAPPNAASIHAHEDTRRNSVCGPNVAHRAPLRSTTSTLAVPPT